MATAAGGKQQTPGVPDYMGAANLMGQQSLYNTQYQTYANRPNINTPYGSVEWTPPDYTPPPNTGGTSGLQTSPLPGRTGAPVIGGAPAVPSPIGDIRQRALAGPSSALIRAGDANDPSVAGRIPDDRTAPAGPDGIRPGGQLPPRGGSGYTEPGQWTMNMTLTPEQQAALDAQNRLGAARSQLGETLFSRAQTELGAAPNWAGLPGAPDANAARQQAIDAVYGQATSRLDPQWDRREEGFRTQLLNEGLRPGMEGYDERMQEFGRSRTDAYDTAMRSAILAGEPVAAGEFGRGLQGRQQGIAEMLQQRGSSLNEINALLGGQQVGMPQMPGFSQAGASQTPDYLGAMGQQYNAQMNNYSANQAQMQSMMGGAASFLPYLMML